MTNEKTDFSNWKHGAALLVERAEEAGLYGKYLAELRRQAFSYGPAYIYKQVIRIEHGGRYTG